MQYVGIKMLHISLVFLNIYIYIYIYIYVYIYICLSFFKPAIFISTS